MTKEQLNALNKMFNQLEELEKLFRRYELGRLNLCVNIDGFTVDNEILNKIARKYTVSVVEDLKEEIKKRKTELESISVLQLNKLV